MRLATPSVNDIRSQSTYIHTYKCNAKIPNESYMQSIKPWRFVHSRTTKQPTKERMTDIINRPHQSHNIDAHAEGKWIRTHL